MPVYDASTACLALKFVYYGAKGSGKTTSLELLKRQLGGGSQTGLLCLDTLDSQTLFFDLLTVVLRLPSLRVLLRLYSVPGEPTHRHTRKLLLRGADGVILVGDATSQLAPETAAMMAELRHNLRESGINVEQMPTVSQACPFVASPVTIVEAALLKLLEIAWPAAERAVTTSGWAPIGAAAVIAELRNRLEPADRQVPPVDSSACGQSDAPARAGDLQSLPRPFCEKEPAKRTRVSS